MRNVTQWFILFDCLLQKGGVFFLGCSMNPDAKRLYDDLLSNYNKLVRPVLNNTDPLPVQIKLKLSQLIDIVSSNYIFDMIKVFNIQ